MQEIFIQVARNPSSFRGDSSFTTWLGTLTINQVRMYFRKTSVRHERVTEDGEMPEVVDPHTINPRAMPVVDRLVLEQAIAQLPKGYRTIFVLHDVFGYEHQEIAALLDCHEGTSKSQLHKARLRLREILQPTH